MLSSIASVRRAAFHDPRPINTASTQGLCVTMQAKGVNTYIKAMAVFTPLYNAL